MTQDQSETDRPPPLPSQCARHPVMRGIWLTLGFLCIVLAVIGALLPIMPTTIFLILAAACFARSSPRLESWLLDHPQLGPPLRAWRRDGAISWLSKAAACGGMVLGYCMFLFLAHPRALTALLVALPLLACATYVMTRPAPKPAKG